MVRSNVLALVLLSGLIAAAAPALADRGGNGNGPGGGRDVSSSIEIATVSGAASTGVPTYGGSITFAATVERLAGWEYPMVALTCYQDVDGDGTIDTDMSGPDIVFGLLREPTATFELAGSSKWAERGGDAVCRADLDAYGWKGGQQSIRVLASTGNWTAAG